ATATMISPIAWEHHYGVFAPILAVLAPALLDMSQRRREVVVLGCVAFVLIAQYFAPAQRLADTAWNPLQSYLFFGALLALTTAYSVMLRSYGRVRRSLDHVAVP